MPAWASSKGGPLSDEQIEDVTAYILTLSPVEGAPTPTPASPGPISLTTGLILLGVVAVLIVIGLIVYYRRA